MARREFTYNEDLPVYRAIEVVARERQISFQQAMHLILVEWYALRGGQPLAAESLWGVPASPYTAVTPPAPPDPPPDDAGARALAEEWM
jgi:hypothetical protein